jgi:Ca-activated chloride channel family protein
VKFPVLLSALVLILLLLTSSHGQQARTTIRAQVDLVNVLFSVFDKKGKHIQGLTQRDVEVYEDGVRQAVEFFGHASGATSEPLTIVMLVDASGSVKDKLALEKSIASDFLKEVLRPEKDLAAIVAFDSNVELVQDFTADLERLNAGLRSITAGGSTSLYDAIYLAAGEELKIEASRKVIVILSDGEDTASKISRREAIDAAQRSDVTVFCIGVKSPDFGANFGALKDCSRETGGRFFEAKIDWRQITGAFREIIDTLKQQYNVSYYSTNTKKDGTFRRIQIRVKKDHPRVQHRIGYFAPRLQ